MEPGVKWMLVAATLLGTSCTVPHIQNRTDFTSAGSQFGAFAEAFHESRVKDTREAIADNVFEIYDEFLLAHVEFDDQGKLWETKLDESNPEEPRNQLEALENRIDSEMSTSQEEYKNGVLMVAFAHGWRNDSREGNGNLDSFRLFLAQMSAIERKGTNRKVVGVYLGWRGGRIDEQTRLGTAPAALTYWDRKATAHNIGFHSMGETLTRLGRLRGRIIRTAEFPNGRNNRTAQSKLILIGHSFGAAAIFSGTQRYFEDQLVRVEQSNFNEHVGRRWDLVLLMNPAFEALRYETIHRYNSQIPAVTKNPFVQLPRMLVVSSKTDQANKLALPVGQTLADLFRPKQANNSRFNEAEQLKTALGFYAPFVTHQLVDENGVPKLKLSENLEHQAGASKKKTHGEAFAPVFVVDGKSQRVMPFMVAQADSEILGSHTDIWGEKFQRFLIQFIGAREKAANLIP